MPGARCTRSLACEKNKAHERSHREVHRRNPAFPHADGFNGFLRALPGDRAFLPPSPPRSLLLKNLTPASGRQDHTTSPSALAALVSRRRRVHRIPHPTSVTIAIRPSCEAGRAGYSFDLGKREAKYFFGQDWTGSIRLKRLRKLVFRRRRRVRSWVTRGRNSTASDARRLRHRRQAALATARTCKRTPVFPCNTPMTASRFSAVGIAR